MNLATFRSRMPTFMKRCYRFSVRRSQELRRLLTGRARMEGRLFDLARKRSVALNGFCLYVMEDDGIGAVIASQRIWEPHVTGLIRRELRPGDTFLDLGANIGYFSMLARSIVGDAGKVIAFEPNPQNVQMIYASLRQNGFANVHVSPCAASDRAGILPFVTVGSNGGVITEHSLNQNCSLLVQSIVLDEALGSEPRIDFVKIDVEGHEPAAIRGMQALLQRHRPKIVTEFHPLVLEKNNNRPPEEYLAQLAQLGYRTAVLLENGELACAHSPREVMDHWSRLGCEEAHLDLYAWPAELPAPCS